MEKEAETNVDVPLCVKIKKYKGKPKQKPALKITQTSNPVEHELKTEELLTDVPALYDQALEPVKESTGSEIAKYKIREVAKRETKFVEDILNGIGMFKDYSIEQKLNKLHEISSSIGQCSELGDLEYYMNCKLYDVYSAEARELCHKVNESEKDVK